MMEKTVVEGRAGLAPKGPYSLATRLGELVFVSGLGPISPDTGSLELGSVEAEVRRTLSNLGAVLQEAGTSLGHVLKVTVYLANLEDWNGMNAVFREFFPRTPPARACVGAALPFSTKVEIDAIAYIPEVPAPGASGNRR